MMHVLKFLSVFIILITFFLDRASKYYILKHFNYGVPYEVLPFFQLTYVENTGVAFGMGQGGNLFFMISTVLILGALLWMRRKWEKEEPDNLKLKVGLALVISGALGNLYDRIAYGFVVDFLDFFVGGWHWPAFNVADSCICVGAFLLALSQWKKKAA